jgi:hypothetical protein
MQHQAADFSQRVIAEPRRHIRGSPSTALRESDCGTFRDGATVRVESAFGGKAEVEIRGRHFRF